ncbi:hypothetical protein TWF569_008753 [Orbilia oligospora]|nr:hypothetical protein TWF569_008753 [Orbilia oligospora]
MPSLTTFLDSLSLTDRQTLPANPSIKDTVDFVSNANRLNSKKKSRIYGERIQPFLDALHQFTGTIDVMVQSNPEIASLVWGSVKFFMTIAMAHNSYFEDELQDAICDFYSVIINLFTKLVAIFRKTGLRAYVKATIRSLKKEFEEFDAKLRQHRGYIDLYIKLASERAHYRERELQAHFRSQVIDYTTRDRNRWDASSNWAIQRDHEHMS